MWTYLYFNCYILSISYYFLINLLMRSVEKSVTELIYIYLGVTEIITAARILSFGISEFIQAMQH